MRAMPIEPEDVLSAWRWPGQARLAGAEPGLINASYAIEVGDAPHAVLQRLNTGIFVPEVHEDIAAVTEHLAASGVPTPRLIPTADGALWHTAADGSVWRCLTWVGRDTVHELHRQRRARSAAALVGRVHAALRDFDWTFRCVRPGAHDTDAYMATMHAAVDANPDHRLHDAVAVVAERIAERWGRWDGPRDLPVRVIHGDLKISNVRFDGDDAVALIDLDTFQHGTLDAELGDAMRSWCNPASEDAPVARFDLGLFDAAMQGYVRGTADAPPTAAEWASIVPGIQRICLELAARFARDALEEQYFGWSPEHGGRGEHNLLRARNQLDLARTVAHAAPSAQRKLDEALAGC